MLNTQYRTPKYIIILSMLYVTAFLFPMMLAYREVHLGPFLLPGGTLFFPASYLFGDIIAEVYGYQLARQLIWSAIVCQLLLALLIVFVLHLPFPSAWHNEADFDLVLGHSLRYAVASIIGNFFGEFINVFLITKFKILLRGRYFWLRSLGATCFGEGALTLVVFAITFAGVDSKATILALMVSGYIFKLLFGLAFIIPAAILVKFLKKNEGVDVYDYSTNFNPFKFSVDKEALSKSQI